MFNKAKDLHQITTAIFFHKIRMFEVNKKKNTSEKSISKYALTGWFEGSSPVLPLRPFSLKDKKNCKHVLNFYS